MTTKKLSKPEWQAYFKSVANSLQAMEVEVEVASLSIGDQIEVEWLPLIGLTYNERDNSFDVATSKLNHRITNVKEISVEQSIAGLNSMEIIDGDNNHQIIKLKPPLALPEVETV